MLNLEPQKLLTPRRLDVLPAVVMARLQLAGVETDFATELYASHERLWADSHVVEFDAQQQLRSLRTFLERSPGSNSDSSEFVVTVDRRSRELVDGKDVVAACLVKGRDVPCRCVDAPAPRYDYAAYRSRAWNEDFLEYLALEYCRHKPSTSFIAVVFPEADPDYPFIRSVLADRCEIAYEKSIHLSRIGLHNLLGQIYKYEPWIGPASRNHPGLATHVVLRYARGVPARFLLLDAPDLQNVKAAKKLIRDRLGRGNLPLHTSDTREETVRIAQQVFNSRSVHFLNSAHPRAFSRFRDLFARYTRWADENNVDRERLAITGGGLMAAYGLRSCVDLDFIGPDIECGEEGIENATSFTREIYPEIDELLFDPRLHFSYDGFKFVTLGVLKEIKQRRGLRSDRSDIRLIKACLEGDRRSYRRWARRIAVLRRGFGLLPSLAFRQTVESLPQWLRPGLRRLYRQVLRCRDIFLAALELVGPRRRILKFRSFRVHYLRGDAFIMRVKSTGETDVALKGLIPWLRENDVRHLLVLGAGFGIVALQALVALPKLKVTCVEERSQHAACLEATVRDNGLCSRMVVARAASTPVSCESGGRRHRTGRSDTPIVDSVDAIVVDQRSYGRWHPRQAQSLLADDRALKLQFVTGGATGSEGFWRSVYGWLGENDYEVMTLNADRHDPESFIQNASEGYYACRRRPVPSSTPVERRGS